jgi:hypothetical protein
MNIYLTKGDLALKSLTIKEFSQDIQTELNLICDSIQSMQGRLEALGYTVSLERISKTSEKQKRYNTSGVSAYWREVKKISKQENCSMGEAREIYKSRSEISDILKNPVVAKKKPVDPVRAAKIRKNQKKYWSKVEEIAKEHNVDKTTARKIYRQQKTA